MVFSSSHSPNRFYVLTQNFYKFFTQSGFFITFHIFYTITLQEGCKFSLSMQIFGLHSPSRCLLLFFVYVSQTLSATEQKHFFDLLHP